MSKYTGVSIKKREFDNGDVRYEIYWTKQHTFFGIKLNKFSEEKDYITFESKKQAEDYIQNVTMPIKRNSCGEASYYYFTPDYRLLIKYDNKNSVYDRFLFKTYQFMDDYHKTFNSIAEYKKCIISKSNVEITLNK